MSLISFLVKGGAKAIRYTGRAAKVTPYVIFGNGAEVAVKTAKTATKTLPIGQAIKQTGTALEQGMAKAYKGGFFKGLRNQLKTTPKVIANSTRWGAKAAKAAGKSGVWGGVKGFFRGVGRRMPLIGNLMLVGFELPNIIKAVKEKGIIQGIAETGKAGARLAGGALGAVICAGILPPFGAIAGWIAGEWLTSKVVGDSYTEKQEEKIAKASEKLMQYGVTEEELAELQKQGLKAEDYERIVEAIEQQAAEALQRQVYYQQQPDAYAPQSNQQVPPNYQYNPFTCAGFSNPYADDIMMKQIDFSRLA